MHIFLLDSKHWILLLVDPCHTMALMAPRPKELKLFSIKVPAQTPSGPNPLFSLQRPADLTLPHLFQTLEPITPLPSQKRGETTMRGNVGCFEFGRSIRRPSRSKAGSSHVAQQVTNPTSIHENVGLIPGLAQWVKDPALPQTAM